MSSLFTGLAALLGTAGTAAAGTGLAAAGTGAAAMAGGTFVNAALPMAGATLAGPMMSTALASSGAAAAGAAGAVGLGSILSTVLSGTATVLSLVAANREAGAYELAGDMEADRLHLEADDAEAETGLESLQGIERRSSIKAALVQALGDADVANAASGLDLSFGSAKAARKESFREADRATASDNATQETRVSRLLERAAQYRRAAKFTRLKGGISASTTRLSALSSVSNRYGGIVDALRNGR